VSSVEARDGTLIERVEIAGLEPHFAATLHRELATKPGTPVVDAPIGDDLRRLWRLGVISDASVEVHDGTVTFHLAPRPAIRSVVSQGGDRLAQARFRQLEDTTFEPARVQRMAEALEESYVRDGRLDARVEARQRVHPQGVDVCVGIVPGPRITIGKVEFPGRTAIPATELVKAMQSKKLNHVGGTFDEAVLDMDVLYMQVLYWDRGYADVKIFPPKIERKGKHLQLAIPIEEGPVYRMGSISANWPIPMPAGIKTGDVFSRQKIVDLRDAIEKLHPGIYLVLPITHADREARTIDIVFEIEWRVPWDAWRPWSSRVR
jgi:outer membrane protein insertion porin family